MMGSGYYFVDFPLTIWSHKIGDFSSSVIWWYHAWGKHFNSELDIFYWFISIDEFQGDYDGHALYSIYKKVPEGYIDYFQEIPGVNTQGDTIDETRENLKEALELILQCRKEAFEKEASWKEKIKELIYIDSSAVT